MRNVLTNEAYVGDNVWNHVSQKLKGKRVRNPKEKWIVVPGAFKPIVTREVFEATQALLEERALKLTDEEMLNRLRGLLGRNGFLSAELIQATRTAPTIVQLRHRFGSLSHAYALIGFAPFRDYSFVDKNHALRRLHAGVVTEIMAGIEDAGGAVVWNADTKLLHVNGEILVAVLISRCREYSDGSRFWVAKLDMFPSADITLIVRMDRSAALPWDYYVFPRAAIPPKRLSLYEHNSANFDAFRISTLQPFFDIAKRTDLRGVVDRS